jgi:hypothetical protein
MFIIHCIGREGIVGKRLKSQISFCDVSVSYLYYFIHLHSCIVVPVLTRHCGVEVSIPASYAGGAGLESDWHCPRGKYCDSTWEQTTATSPMSFPVHLKSSFGWY